PVVVRSFYHLFHSRPEVVSKFCTFNHYADLVIETRHTDSSTKDKVFGDRTVKYTVFSEFLLHSLGDVEDTALFFVSYVLTPDISVRVMSELSFQCAVDRINEFLRL